MAEMIYCVVPKALADELYPKLVEHYKDDANVTVIVDAASSTGAPAAGRQRRCRRRGRAAAGRPRPPPRACRRRPAAARARLEPRDLVAGEPV